MIDGVIWLDHQNLFANFVLENVMQDSLGVHMSELNWEGLECVSFWYVVFDTCLEFIVGKCCARY